MIYFNNTYNDKDGTRVGMRKESREWTCIRREVIVVVVSVVVDEVYGVYRVGVVSTELWKSKG
jgi:hypothetical protein